MPRALTALIAEDHPVNQKVLGLLLESLDVQFDCANNGKEAIAAAADGNYKIILMDCMMPELDGFQAAFSIRKREFEQNKYTPIIACTALDKDQILERCVMAGMNDYIIKPIGREMLRRKLVFWSLAFEPLNQISATVAEEIARLESTDTEEPINRIYLDLLYGVQQLEEVLHLFLTVTARLIETLESAITLNDAFAVRNIAHEIKGSSYAVNAREMAKICRDLENSSEKQDWAETKRLFETLRLAFARVEQFLQGKELIA